MSGKLKYHWHIVDMSGYDCSTGYCVTCPVCGFSYRVAYKDSFRFCPECGRQLCSRKQITYDKMVYNVEEKEPEREPCIFKSKNYCAFCVIRSECNEYWKEGETK